MNAEGRQSLAARSLTALQPMAESVPQAPAGELSAQPEETDAAPFSGQGAGKKKRSGGRLRSLFGCGGSKRSSSPVALPRQPPSETKPATAGPSNVAAAAASPTSSPSGNNGNAAVVDSPRDNSGPAIAGDQAFDPNYMYNMRHEQRGLALVFNFQEFSPELGLSYRHGSDKDSANIEAALRRLQFKVHRHNNLTAAAFIRELRQVAEVNHRDSDAIAIVIMSHGEEGIIFAQDCQIPLSDVFEPFRQCQTLVGKPKLFFMQACRGNKFDSGMEQADLGEEDTEAEAFNRAVDTTDGIRSIQRLPTDADFLICYSVVPGYFSWRNGAHGSWFVQKLTEVLGQTDCAKVDFMRVMTRVNRAVAFEFESHTNNPQLDRKKQVPSIVSMLTKELYFPVRK